MERRLTKKVLPTAGRRGGQGSAPCHPPGLNTPAGHCQPPCQGPWHLLALVGGIFHSATQQGQDQGLWAPDGPGGACLGKVAYPIRPHFLRLGQGGKADGTCQWGEGEALCSLARPRPAPSLPTQVGVEAAHWSQGPPWLKT